MEKEISQRSTKKELWDAYQAVLQDAIQKSQKSMPVESADVLVRTEEEKVLQESNLLSTDKVMGDIGNLKMSAIGALNDIGDKISEALRKLDYVSKAIDFKQVRLKDLYNIEAEAVELFHLIEAKEKERNVLEYGFQTEKERMERQIDQIKKQHEREEEEYAYNLKISRQQEQDENDFKNKVKERDFNEKMAAKQKEISLREGKIAEQESEIKDIRLRFEKLPEEIESIKNQSSMRARDEAMTQAKIDKDLLAKDYSKESDIAKLKISSLEEIIKKQSEQVYALESQLSIALQKTQELAVKIIESGKKDKEPEKMTSESGK